MRDNFRFCALRLTASARLKPDMIMGGEGEEQLTSSNEAQLGLGLRGCCCWNIVRDKKSLKMLPANRALMELSRSGLSSN